MLNLSWTIKSGYFEVNFGVSGRPTEYNEDDVYVCDNRYYPDEKIITKLKKGIRVSFELRLA